MAQHRAMAGRSLMVSKRSRCSYNGPDEWWYGITSVGIAIPVLLGVPSVDRSFLLCFLSYFDFIIAWIIGTMRWNLPTDNRTISHCSPPPKLRCFAPVSYKAVVSLKSAIRAEVFSHILIYMWSIDIPQSTIPGRARPQSVNSVMCGKLPACATPLLALRVIVHSQR